MYVCGCIRVFMYVRVFSLLRMCASACANVSVRFGFHQKTSFRDKCSNWHRELFPFLGVVHSSSKILYVFFYMSGFIDFKLFMYLLFLILLVPYAVFLKRRERFQVGLFFCLIVRCKFSTYIEIG